MGIFSSKTKTTNYEEMLTPEQKQAMQLLTQFGTTGKLGDFTAGQGADLSGFNFNMTGAENMGQDQLYNLLNSGTSTDMSTASKTLQGIANQTFNPDDPSSGFGAFSRQVARSGKTASDALDREAAMTGSRFGTGIQRQKTDLAAQQSDILGSKLGELYSQLQNNKLAAAGGLADIDAQQEAINQNRISAAYNYGTRERDLQNQKAQLAYDDWQKSRAERMSSISGLTDVMNKNVEWGLKSVSTKEPGIGMKMWGTVNPLVGEYNSQQYGYTSGQSRMSDLIKLATKAATGGMGAPTV